MLWQREGFDSQDDMDAWFRAVLKPGTTTEMHLCRFKVRHDLVEDAFKQDLLTWRHRQKAITLKFTPDKRLEVTEALP